MRAKIIAFSKADPHLNPLPLLKWRGGKERTQEEYAELAAKCGLKLRRMIETRSPYSILEMVAA